MKRIFLNQMRVRTTAATLCVHDNNQYRAQRSMMISVHSTGVYNTRYLEHGELKFLGAI